MALRVGPRGLEVKIDAAYGGLRSLHGPCGPLSVRRFCDFEDGLELWYFGTLSLLFP